MAQKMKFGVKTTNESELGGGVNGGDFIRYIRENGETSFLFLEEFDDWTVYWEHYSQEKKASYPCTGDRKECPGCQSPDERESKASKKYLVNAITGPSVEDGSTDGAFTNLWKLPKTAVDDLKIAFDKDGTVLRRPYAIIRFEKDNGFVGYTMMRGDRMDKPIDPDDYQTYMKDHQESLQEAWDYAWDADYRAQKQAEIEERKSTREDKKVEKADEEPKQATRTVDKVNAAREKARKPEPEPEPETKPEPETDTDEDFEMDLDDLKKMSRAELSRLLDQLGVPGGDDMTRGEMIDAVLEIAAEDEE